MSAPAVYGFLAGELEQRAPQPGRGRHDGRKRLPSRLGGGTSGDGRDDHGTVIDDRRRGRSDAVGRGVGRSGVNDAVGKTVRNGPAARRRWSRRRDHPGGSTRAATSARREAVRDDVAPADVGPRRAGRRHGVDPLGRADSGGETIAERRSAARGRVGSPVRRDVRNGVGRRGAGGSGRPRPAWGRVGGCGRKRALSGPLRPHPVRVVRGRRGDGGAEGVRRGFEGGDKAIGLLGRAARRGRRDFGLLGRELGQVARRDGRAERGLGGDAGEALALQRRAELRDLRAGTVELGAERDELALRTEHRQVGGTGGAFGLQVGLRRRTGSP